MIQSVLHYLSNMINTDDVAVDRSSRINCKVYSLLMFTQMLQTVQHFIVQMDNDPKHTAKITQPELCKAKTSDILDP